MAELQGRVILVTGAGGAVGGALCDRLLAEGAKVVGLDHRARGVVRDGFLERTVDLTDERAVAQAFDDGEKALGKLWGVAHVAGGWKGGTPVADTGVDVLESLLSTNVRTTFLVAREAMRRLSAHGGGRIVTVGSHTAAKGIKLAGSAAYNLSKAAVVSLTQALAEEGRERGVFANCVAPGTIATGANRAAMPGADATRWATVDQVVDALCTGLSPRSGLNGVVLSVPGLD